MNSAVFERIFGNLKTTIGGLVVAAATYTVGVGGKIPSSNQEWAFAAASVVLAGLGAALPNGAIGMPNAPKMIFLALALFAATPAEAVGVVVGTNCEAAWVAPTTNTDGSPIVGTLTYNLYIASGTPATPPATPSIVGVVANSQVKICTSLAPGQYTFWVTAVETPGTFSSSESAKSPAFPFVLVVPTAPGGVGIK